MIGKWSINRKGITLTLALSRLRRIFDPSRERGLDARLRLLGGLGVTLRKGVVGHFG